jgi:hypothetical protein
MGTRPLVSSPRSRLAAADYCTGPAASSPTVRVFGLARDPKARLLIA